MDDLTRYIFQNYSHLMTLEEHAAYRSVQSEQKAQASDNPRIQDILRRSWRADDPKVQVLLQEGSEAFLVNVHERILQEHADQVILNHCPHCSALARTPKARQCPKCFHSWRG
jgi:hypothetical protein